MIYVRICLCLCKYKYYIHILYVCIDGDDSSCCITIIQSLCHLGRSNSLARLQQIRDRPLDPVFSKGKRIWTQQLPVQQLDLWMAAAPRGFTDFRSSFCEPCDKVSKLSKHISNSQTQTWGTLKWCMAARIETNSFQSKSRQAHPSHWLNRATCCMVHSVIFSQSCYSTVCFLMFLDALRLFVWYETIFPKKPPPHEPFRGRPQRQGWSPAVLGANG